MTEYQHKRNLKQAIAEHEKYIATNERYGRSLKKALNRYKSKLAKLTAPPN